MKLLSLLLEIELHLLQLHLDMVELDIGLLKLCRPVRERSVRRSAQR